MDRPVTEVEAANSLIETGIDVLSFDQSDSLPIVKTAESKGIKICGCYADVHQFVPKQWLTGPNLNWGPFYVKTCQSVLAHNWKSEVHICNIASNEVELAPFGPSVPNAVREEVLGLKEKINAGKLVIFAGPVEDSQGNIRLTAGEKPDIHWLSQMSFFVKGVSSTLPKE